VVLFIVLQPLLGAVFNDVLTERVERNDRVAVERGVGEARAAIQRYRDLAGGDNAVDPDLEAMTLTLDQVAALATASLSAQERQP